MKASIVDQPSLKLITCRSEKFPEGNAAAFNAIEEQLSTMRGRKFYGLVYGREDGLEYHAGLVPADECEVAEFVGNGFQIVGVPGGPCARVKMLDWAGEPERIGPTFGAMIGKFGIDPSRPQMEFYRSQRELHLILPIESGG